MSVTSLQDAENVLQLLLKTFLNEQLCQLRVTSLDHAENVFAETVVAETFILYTIMSIKGYTS